MAGQETKLDIDPDLKRVIEAVLGPDAEIRSIEDGPGTVTGWDSLNHLNLILAVEAEFDVRFETSEIPELLTVGKIQERLTR